MGSVEQVDVVIAGAGPAGVFLACRLVELGKRVVVLEKDEVPQVQVRAIGYYGATQYALHRAGLFEEAKKKGYFQLGFSWRKATRSVAPDERVWGELIAKWNPWEDSDLKLGDVGHGMLTLGQDKLREIALNKLEASPLARVYLGHPVIDLDQTDEGVTVTSLVTATGEKKQFIASFMVGADGGKSATRRLIGQSLDGYTWRHNAVGVDLLIDLPPPGDGPGTSGPIYLLDPEFNGHFCSLAEYKGQPIMWRFTVPMPPEECEPGVFRNYLERNINSYCPGKRPLKYEIINANPYTVHQRQVKDYLSGRVMLIGDAAHLNSPTGGLGLTTGILDADSLAEAFVLILDEGKDKGTILRTWADHRHAVWKNIISPRSEENQKRLLDLNPDNAMADPFLRMVVENDPKLKNVNHEFDKQIITNMRELIK